MPIEQQSPTPDAEKKAPAVKLISVEKARTKMTEQEKATFDRLQTDFMKASGICKPLLRKLSVKREKLCDAIAFVDESASYVLGLGTLALTVPTPFILGAATLNNLNLMAYAIEAKMDQANIDELDNFSAQLEKVSDDFYGRFMKYRREMREKYSR